jgi:hypothetical protein
MPSVIHLSSFLRLVSAGREETHTCKEGTHTAYRSIPPCMLATNDSEMCYMSFLQVHYRSMNAKLGFPTSSDVLTLKEVHTLHFT